MKIEQFTDHGLAHYSYAIVSNKEMVLIDPSRNPQPYIDFAKENDAIIKAVIETHSHADFISSHMEFLRYGSKIYCSKHTEAHYPHIPFDEPDVLQIGYVKLKAINTPGHSLDSISILLIDQDGTNKAVFTGDTLFIGDVGRPDLRETNKDIQQQKEKLAASLFDSLREKLMILPDSVTIYPAHGAGSFCGKSMSKEPSAILGDQLKENYALKEMNKEEFIQLILEDQPPIPKYFSYDVTLNKQGPPLLKDSLSKIKEIQDSKIGSEIVIDSRSAEAYQNGFMKNSINIPNGLKFETWLGSIVAPNEKYYLITEKNEQEELLYKISKIGYELNLLGILLSPNYTMSDDTYINIETLKNKEDDYNIIDVREKSEQKVLTYFNDSKNIPLGDLRENLQYLKSDKPTAVHCAGGYRSAIAYSIIKNFTNIKTFDIGKEIEKIKPIIK